MKRLANLLLLLFVGLNVSAKIIVHNAEELNAALQKAKPGDTLFLKNKEWKDAALILKGKGTAKKWIVVMPESPGGVKLTGNSYLQLAGEYILVKDLHFTNGFTPKREVISFRVDNNNLANHCRVSGIVIDNYSQPQRFKADTWITLYGKHNRIDHSTFVSKLNTGPLIIAELDDERSQENYHSIDSNYFKGRPRFGSNGGETIRIGVSRYSLTASRTSIMHNFFERCNGEVEFVSIKSGENRIAFNTFYECEGGLVLRHGSKNIVEGNFFIGNNKPYTGGVRIVNPGHKVFNNVFYQLKGTNFRAPLGIMNGVPNSLINRYYQVKDVAVSNNTFIDCAPLLFGTGKDAERTLSPQDVTFNNNLFVSNHAALIENANDDQGIKMMDNAVKKGNEVKLTEGFKVINVKNTAVKSFNIPSDAKYGAAIKKLSLIQQQHTGASWYQPVHKVAARKAKSFVVGVKQSKDLAGIVSQALDGDTIILADTGYYRITEVIRINKSLVLSGAKDLKARPILVNSSYKSLPAFISIENGGRLLVKNIAFKGTYESFSDVKSGIQSTTLAMNQPYYLNVDGCEFYDFNESTQSGIEASKGTYADSLLVSNSIFHHISGSGINLSAEKDDKGIYNAENVIIKNCLFTNLLGSAINIYRGGNDESTLGPFVTIDYCTFNEVENREQGTVIKLIGAQNASVTNSSFYNSGQGGRSILFQEYRWDNILVDYCNFYQSGKVESFYNKAVGQHIFAAAPESGKLKIASSNQQLLGATVKL
jgi:poly(beta-D-mannuronate) lyase